MGNANNTPNAQGKGLVPLLSDLENFKPQASPTRAPAQLLAEYFSSILVLSTHFRFKPVAGKDYYLYLKQDNWQLSMIEPQRWSQDRRGIYLGRCQLQPDMTWTIDVIEDIEQQPELQAALRTFQQRLTEHLDSDIPIEQQLPFYEASLPFYARLSATGLAKSLSASFAAHGMLQQASRKWLQASQ